MGMDVVAVVGWEFAWLTSGLVVGALRGGLVVLFK